MIPKYQAHFEKHNLTECPPPDCINVKMMAFRFSYVPLDNELNFMPQAVKREKGHLPARKNVKPAQLCSDYGISMYATKENALRSWTNLKAVFGDKFNYTHLTKGQLNEEDGVITEIEKNGHFNLFEYVNSGCLQNFVVEVTLP